MRILYLIDGLGLGGKERQLLELIKQLLADDANRICLVVLSKNIHYAAVEELAIEKHFIQRTSRKDPKVLAKLFHIARCFQPEIIHSWELMCSVYAAPISKLTGSRFVNGFIRRAPVNPALARARFTYPFSDKILSNSYAGLASYRVPEAKAVCIHNGFDFSRLTDLEAPSCVRTRFAITTPRIVGMVARFHPRKHFESFVLAAQEILLTRKDVTFVTVGDGDTLAAVKQQVKPEFYPHIRFLGRQQDVESLINIFDVGVLLSLDEGISNVLMEYMAQAKPVIATDHGGNGELVVAGQTGFLVAPLQVDEVVAGLRCLLADRALAETMGQAGKQRLQSEFGIKKMVRRYLGLYQSLLGPRNSLTT